MKEIKKMNLSNAMVNLTRNEMRNIMAGSGSQYCRYSCKSGGGSGSSSGTTYEETVSIATSNCGAGNFSIVCVG